MNHRRHGALVVGCFFTFLACSESASPPEAPEAAAPPASVEDTVEAWTEPAESADWVAIYDPARASNGYTLVFHHRRVPMLIDMNGRIVHSWPEARAKSRLRLLPDGSLLTINLGRAVTEYGWDGEVRWELRLKEEIPHHDLIRLRNGNTLLVIRRKSQRTDDLLEVDRDGEIVWTWKSGHYLDSFFDERARQHGDITHINSVQELPENPWFDDGDDRFRPGNLLISARNLNRIFVVDRQTGEVAWLYGRHLDRQHEALMIGPGLSRHGNILLFNNGYGSRHRYRQTSVVEISPIDGEVTWQYHSDDFYSPTGGIEQPLPNGNLLVSSSRGGRVFELTRDRQVVWQWTPPFQPNRPRRIAYDHCPQLAALDRPTETAVHPPIDYRYVDPAVYQFARRNGQRVENVNGQMLRILARNDICHELFLPAAARVDLTFGLNRRALRQAGRDGYQARFGLRLAERDSGMIHNLLEETLNVAGEFQRHRNLSLARWAHRRVEMCVETVALDSVAGEATEPFAYWVNPVVLTENDQRLPDGSEDDSPEGLTDEEIEVRKEHLRALGYVD